METQTLLLESLESRWESYRTELKKCRREFSEEAVHDLRVAARRLLALTELIRAVEPNPVLQKIRKALKGQLDEFDDLRDTQVMLAEVSESIEALPELKPFQQHLQKRERRLLRDAEEIVEVLRPAGLAKRLEKVREKITEQDQDAALGSRILQAVDESYLTVTQRYGWIDPARPATIHHTRVAFKKFRYMVEAIHPILPDFPEANFKRMHDYQTAMGEIQDVEVFLHSLRDFAEADTPETVVHYYERIHTDLITAYIEDKGELHSFWRATPEASYPWEKIREPLHRPARNRRGTGNATRRPAPAH